MDLTPSDEVSAIAELARGPGLEKLSPAARSAEAAAQVDGAVERRGDRATIYYYYRSKHEIFIDLIQQTVEEVVVLAESVAKSDPSATERLRDIFVKTLDADLFLHGALTDRMREGERAAGR